MRVPLWLMLHARVLSVSIHIANSAVVVMYSFVIVVGTGIGFDTWCGVKCWLLKVWMCLDKILWDNLDEVAEMRRKELPGFCHTMLSGRCGVVEVQWFDAVNGWMVAISRISWYFRNFTHTETPSHTLQFDCVLQHLFMVLIVVRAFCQNHLLVCIDVYRNFVSCESLCANNYKIDIYRDFVNCESFCASPVPPVTVLGS